MALRKLLKFAKNVSERAERKARRKPKTRTAEGSTGSAFSGSAADLKQKLGAGNPKLLDASERAKVKKRRVAEQNRKAKEKTKTRAKKVAGTAAVAAGAGAAGYALGRKGKGDKSKAGSELQVELKKRESKRGKVTGKKDTKADRDVTLKGGKKVANVTREQLEKLGLDPNKKSSLTKYLNAYDRLGRRPKTKADLAAKKNMGGMMKAKGYSRGGAAKKAKGYAKGGAAKKTKGYSRGGAVKRRGVGAATRGFGKAMR